MTDNKITLDEILPEIKPPTSILEALNRVMLDVGYVQKGSTNSFHHYNYASEADLLITLRPALVNHGLLLIPSLEGFPSIDEYGNTNLVMSYTLAHTSGDVWPEKIRMPGCGNDKNTKGGIGDKGAYKALTGANKYLLFKLLQIATGDDPENGDEPPAPEPKAAPRVRKAAEAPPVVDSAWILPVPMKGDMPDWVQWVENVETLIVNAKQATDIDNISKFNRANLATLEHKVEDNTLFQRLRIATNVRRTQLKEEADGVAQ